MADEGCWAEQADEAVALAAILEDAFEARGPSGAPVEPEELLGDTEVRPGELRFFMSVEVAVPDGGLALDLARARRGEGSCAGSSVLDQAQIYILQHLPPVSLQVELPERYPLYSAPTFWLVCPWITPGELGAVRRALEALWEQEASGGAVCFLWYEFLQHSVLELLGFAGGELRLKARNARDGEGVAVQLVQYNERRKHLDFCRASHRCGVCLEERLGAEMHVLQPCRHHFCRACISDLCELHVREGSIDKLQCPEPSCRAELGPGLLRRVLSEDLFLRLSLIHISEPTRPY